MLRGPRLAQRQISQLLCCLSASSLRLSVDGVRLEGFIDANWAGNSIDGKTTSDGILSIGSTVISWNSTKQTSVVLSSIETEYMATSQTTYEAIWMRKLLVRLFRQRIDPTMINCDNQSCIKLSQNLMFHDRSKHIKIEYRHLRDCVQKGIMELPYIPTREQISDILTKAFARSSFFHHKDKLGVV
eukprot:PITA_10447